MKVAIVHPDLGLGGAERLILDIALALKRRKHDVKIITGYHDTSRCFVESRDGTIDVEVAGSSVPRTLFGRFHALLAYVSACIPFLRLSRKFTIFYCHYPDQLLTHRYSLLKKIYRWPLDWFEQFTTGQAGLVLVNSEFTANVFRQTFTSLSDVRIQVLYPTVDFTTIQRFRPSPERLQSLKSSLNGDDFVILSLNRYERKKNLELSIRALSILAENDPTTRPRIHLIIAGGYDERLSENRDYYEELLRLSFELSVRPMITFIKSPDDDDKLELLYLCDAVVYTPENEHFGIVPLEGMAMGKPVIACQSGGPLETIVHGKTGFLCKPRPEEFAKAMATLSIPNDRRLARRMGEMARQRVEKYFSFEKFSSELINICEQNVSRLQ